MPTSAQKLYTNFTYYYSNKTVAMYCRVHWIQDYYVRRGIASRNKMEHSEWAENETQLAFYDRCVEMVKDKKYSNDVKGWNELAKDYVSER
jgi:hypothetical protein